MNLECLLKSKALHVALALVGGFFVVVLVFHAGQLIGFRKAKLSFGLLGSRSMLGMDRDFFHDFREREMINNHGASGVVVGVAEPFFIMQSSSGLEREVLVSNTTIIRRGPSSITLQEVEPANRVVVLGRTEEAGALEAKFIRILEPVWPSR